jgi:hypothetical protein
VTSGSAFWHKCSWQTGLFQWNDFSVWLTVRGTGILIPVSWQRHTVNSVLVFVKLSVLSDLLTLTVMATLTHMICALLWVPGVILLKVNRPDLKQHFRKFYLTKVAKNRIIAMRTKLILTNWCFRGNGWRICLSFFSPMQKHTVSFNNWSRIFNSMVADFLTIWTTTRWAMWVAMPFKDGFHVTALSNCVKGIWWLSRGSLAASTTKRFSGRMWSELWIDFDYF